MKQRFKSQKEFNFFPAWAVAACLLGDCSQTSGQKGPRGY